MEMRKPGQAINSRNKDTPKNDNCDAELEAPFPVQ